MLSFDCYIAVPILLEQIGVYKNLSAAISGWPMNVLAPITFRSPVGLVPGARRVAVVGPFNGWSRTAHVMSRRADGDWTVTIYLPRGRVVYLFDVDGQCWLDPDDDERMPNSWGSEYSVRYVITTSAGAKDAERPQVPAGREAMTTEERSPDDCSEGDARGSVVGSRRRSVNPEVPC